MAQRTLEQLAAHTGGRIVGDPGVIIHSVSTLASAATGQITFLNNKRYLPLIKTTKAC